MGDTRQHILQTLAYFDIFQYPLSREEIRDFHGENCSQAIIDDAIRSLLNEQAIFFIGEFYSLHNDLNLAERRSIGNRLAEEQMHTANKAAKILSRFPYVRGLAISGSLSKNYSTKKTDIDFFIITAANRLWIARTLMHLYKKLTFITGRQHWFCMNYYVDEAEPEIIEKNIYTAIEVATLLHMHGAKALKEFMLANAWAGDHLPVYQKNHSSTPEIKKSLFCKLIEGIFNNKLGNALDNRLMKITNWRWQKKVQRHKKNDKGFNIGMMVGKHFSKPNPTFFQDKVLELYAEKIKSLPRVQTEMIDARI